MRIGRGIALALGLLLAAAAPAGARVDVTSLTATPSSTQAGGHPDLTISMSFSPSPASDDVRNLTVTLPPGLVGNPQAVAKCAVAQFTADACPPGSDVGDTTVHVTDVPLLGSVDASGDVYNLQPQAGEPARLGVVVRPPAADKIFLQAPIAILPDQGTALQNRITDIPRTTNIFLIGSAAVTITQMSLTLKGVVGGQNFLTLPSSCSPGALTVDAVSWDQPSVTTHAQTQITPTGCAAEAFHPRLSLGFETTRAETPSGASVTLSLPDGSPTLRDAVVTLPPGVTVNPGVGQGLAGCSDAQFAAAQDAAPACPAGSDVGDVTFDTPLLGVLPGDVYFAQPTAAEPMRVFVAIHGPGFWSKLVGHVSVDPATGRIATAFHDLPQVPFTNFTLSFKGGSHAMLATPSSCGTTQATAVLTPWSSSTATTVTAPLTTSWDGAGAPCPGSRPFAPALAVSLGDPTAGAAGAMTITLTRPDRDAPVRTLAMSLPAGMLGRLAMPGLTMCAPAVAARGACPASSKVGRVHAESGPGATPLALDGDVFLTQGTGGAIAGLSIRIPAKAGPLDLGNVIVGTGLRLRTSDFGLDIAGDPLPQMLAGIPLGVRRLQITLDRPGFLRNATACGTKVVTGTVGSADGRVAHPQATFAIGGCDRVPFRPAVTGAMGARGLTAPGAGVPVSVKVGVPPDGSALRRVQVALPSVLGPNLAAAGNPCPVERFAKGTCPASNRIGTARVTTPLLPGALQAPVLLVARPGGGLPRIAVTLLGRTLYGDISLTTTSIVNTFDDLPDIPLSSFELAIDGGRDGLLQAKRSLCARGVTGAMRAVLLSQGGRQVTLQPRLAIQGCAPARPKPAPRPALHAGVRVRGGHALLSMQIRMPAGVAALKALRIRLPKALAPEPTRGRRVTRPTRGARWSRASYRGRLATLQLRRAQRVTRLAWGGLRPSRSLAAALRKHRRARVTLVVRLVDSRGRARILRPVAVVRGR